MPSSQRAEKDRRSETTRQSAGKKRGRCEAAGGPPRRRGGQTEAQEPSAGQHSPEKRARAATPASEGDKENAMEALESDDYFEVLGLPRSCSDADVKRAYRKLAVQWHPDKNRSEPRAEEFFKKVGEAYAVLSDPEKRARYEALGKAGLESSASAGATGHGVYEDDPFGLGGRAAFSSRHARDIFDAFFGGTDPFVELLSGFGSPLGPPRRSRQARGSGGGLDGDMGFGGFGPTMTMGFGGGGGGGGGGGLASMMGAFFGDGGFGADAGGFSSFSSGFGGLAGGSFSSSVSSSTFTDQNGHVVTKKTTTTVDAAGRAETVTEEFRNGRLVSSTSSASTSRLAGAGRMHLGGAPVSSDASLAPSAGVAPAGGDTQPSRRQSSSSRSRPRY